MKKILFVLFVFIQFIGFAQRIIKENCIGTENTETIIASHENDDSTLTIIYNELNPFTTLSRLKALKLDKYQNIVLNKYIDTTARYYESFSNLVHFQDNGNFITTNFPDYNIFDKDLNHTGATHDTRSYWYSNSFFVAGKPDGGYILVGYNNNGFEGGGSGKYNIISLSGTGTMIWNTTASETELYTNAYVVQTSTCTIIPKENNKAVISLKSINMQWPTFDESLNYTIALDSAGNIENEYSTLAPVTNSDLGALFFKSTYTYQPGKLPTFFYRDSTLHIILLNTSDLSILKEDSLKLDHTMPYMIQQKENTDSSNLFFVFNSSTGQVPKVICKDLNLTTLWSYDFTNDSIYSVVAIDNHTIWASNTLIRDGVRIWSRDFNMYDTINYNGQVVTSYGYSFLNFVNDKKYITTGRTYSSNITRIMVIDINTGLTVHDYFLNNDRVSDYGTIKYVGDDKLFISNTDYNTCGFGSSDIHLATYSNEYNTIKGGAYIDYNNNNTRENNEPVYPYGYVTAASINDTLTEHLSTTAPFTFYVNTGTYITSLHLYNDYYNIIPPQFTSPHFTYGNSDTAIFALHPMPDRNDVSIQLVNNWITRLGKPNAYTVPVENKGTTVSNGKVKVVMDSRLLNITTIPNYSGRNGDTLIWNISNLAPLQKGTAIINFTGATPTTLNVNDTVISKAWFESDSFDLTAADNYAEVKETISASLDPNEKTIMSGEILTPSQISSGNYISYIIHFQNKGNDTAYKVIVLDTLSEYVDVNSLQIINSSYPYTLEIIHKNILKFTFDNIRLSYDTSSVSSIGYIAYKIKPKTDISLGNTIDNTANIFFDFNPPVKTNTVQTRILLVSAINQNKNSTGKMIIYPNPNTGIFTISYESKNNSIIQLQLLDITGNIIYRESKQHQNKTEFTINEVNLIKGIYWIKLTDGNDIYSSAVIAQ